MAIASLTGSRASGQELSDDPGSMCARAASKAERQWQLPQGLLAAIGIVESGRRSSIGTFPIIWPWTINADGQGYYQPTKAAAVAMVRLLQQRGARLIDVGCFQIDLFYHPFAFSGLEQAFDPDANAAAAARILSLGRLSNTAWDGAIAAYHSAVPLLGMAYLQKVRAVWPWVKTHPGWEQPDAPEEYAVLLSPQARLVRVVTPLNPAPSRASAVPDSAPAVQWLHQPETPLPRVLTPSG